MTWIRILLHLTPEFEATGIKPPWQRLVPARQLRIHQFHPHSSGSQRLFSDEIQTPPGGRSERPRSLRHFPEQVISTYSTATMTLEALITANASRPTASSRASTDAFVIIATTSAPGATSRVTSQFTAPSTILMIRPFRTFRALTFIRWFNQKAAPRTTFVTLPASPNAESCLRRRGSFLRRRAEPGAGSTPPGTGATTGAVPRARSAAPRGAAATPSGRTTGAAAPVRRASAIPADVT